MEMERINDDTIRVLVTNDDLTERSISMVELLGNQDAIEKFFYSILEEVDLEHDFEQNDAVTFQVLPNRNGLEMFISKNIPEDQIPTEILNNILGDRNQDEANDEISDDLLSQLLESDTGKKPQQQSGKNKNSLKPGVDASAMVGQQQGNAVPHEIIVKFSDFESIIQLAKALNLASATKLIEYQNDYFLELNFDSSYSLDEIRNVTAIAREFGTLTPVAAEVLAEHGRVIFAENALDQVLNYFK
ncbi:MAG: adaptor protein MecA [Lactobacillaceae bacterium]|jgi:adapter protein MecA 1/2|nr:adaptor protein MecA [Lactobacillaceae bacterium]